MSDVVEACGNDAALIERLQGSGAGTALREIVRCYSGMVYGTCLRVTGDAHTAADATQETFFELLRRPRGVRGSLAAWLHAMARRRSIDIVRQDTARRRRERVYAAAPREVSQWAELSPVVDEALEGLRPEAREVLVRHYLGGESMVALAAALGVSQPTISRRVSQALEELRAKLRKMGVLAAAPALMGMMPAARGEVPAAVAQELGKMALTASAGVGGGLAGVGWAMKAVAAVVLAAVAGFAGYEVMKPAAAVPQGVAPGAVAAPAAENPQVMPEDGVAALAGGADGEAAAGGAAPMMRGMAFRPGVGMGGFDVAMGGMRGGRQPEWLSANGNRGPDVANGELAMGDLIPVAAPRAAGGRGDTAEAARAREVLARFAENQNKLAAMSYVETSVEQTTGDIVGTVHQKAEVRWDGDRADRRQWRWGDMPASSKRPMAGAAGGHMAFNEEKAEYRHEYWEGTNKLMFYRWDVPWWEEYPKADPRPGYVEIDATTDSAAFRRLQAIKGDATPLFGYFNLGEERCDIMLSRAGAQVKLRQATEPVGGVPCQVVDGRLTDKWGQEWRYALWFDPAHGYNIARADVLIGPNKNTGASYDLHLVRSEFVRSGDLWLPAKAEIQYTSVHAGGAATRGKVQVQLTDVHVGAQAAGWQKAALQDIPEGVEALLININSPNNYKVQTRGVWKGGRAVDGNGKAFFEVAVPTTGPAAAESRTPGGGQIP